MNNRLRILFFALVLLLCSSTTRNAAAQTINTRIVKDSLFIPWEIIWGPDGNIWLTQKNGYICRLHPASGVLDTLYHETATVVQNEGGMLGMALHPLFPTQPYVYVVYDYLSGSLYRERVVRYTYNGSNSLGSPLILLDNVVASSIHNGSRLLIIGDKLYITTGDASTMSNAQSNSSPNGKIHRINLDGTIPADNPIPGSTIWSKGHRNPQGVVYANGFLYSSEHGNTTDDELNIIKKGRNYGWPTVEGFCNTATEMQFCNDSNVVQPLYAWTPTLAVCGLDYFGGAVSPYNNAFPTWVGSLIMCTLKDQHLYQLKLNAAKDSIISAAIISGINFGRLRDICISPQGKIYISTSNSNAGGAGAKIDRIIELSDPNAASIDAIGQATFSLYPNPVKETLFISGLSTAAPYAIYNITGALLKAGIARMGTEAIDLRGIAAGTYLLRVGSSSGQVFVKQ